MLRSTKQVSAAHSLARKHFNIVHVTDDGREFRFWSLAPAPKTVWLTDGKEFLLYSTEHNGPAYLNVENTFDDLRALDAARATRGIYADLPLLDDKVSESARMVEYKKTRAANGFHAN